MFEKKDGILETKSYTGIYDLFGSTPFSNVLYRNFKKDAIENSDLEENTANAEKKLNRDESLNGNDILVTSEKYHELNKQLSFKSIIRSSSTIFYDLDDIAKRHSFHCLTEVSISNANILKVMKLPVSSAFEGKSNAIVQECATQMRPQILANDSLKILTQKGDKKFPHNDILSSEIFLKDNGIGKHCRKNNYYNIDVTKPQKFWSYAKYRTELTKPIGDKKIKKNKDKGKRTEDPCPCQLFSYTCPCSDEKSLSQLANNSKCLVVTDQITSTTKITQDIKKKKKNQEAPRVDKITNTIVVEKADILIDPKIEPNVPIGDKADKAQDKHILNNSRSRRKKHKLICPKCNERIEALSVTEDEESLKCNSKYGSKEIESTAAYNCSTSSRSKNKNQDEVCSHEPRCELIPICQILPIDANTLSSKCSKKKASTKSAPRVIRITKACRHHPPCTVVPSCQRANVLRNNCEFIPPCLHRPRCVNLPLCVPLTKSIHYEEMVSKEGEKEMSDCPHIPKCKLISMCQHDNASLTNNIEQHYNVTSRIQNVSEFIKNYDSNYFLNPKHAISPFTQSPVEIDMHNGASCSCKSNKSCQFSCVHCKCDSINDFNKGSITDEAVIYIRDVGCQFQYKPTSPNDSLLRSNTSSASFELVDLKTEKYFTNIHTLRYENKCTNSTTGAENISHESDMSEEIDSNCPSHGHYSKSRYSGFMPKTGYVAAYVNVNSIMSTKQPRDSNKTDPVRHRETFPVKSRRSFLKGKYRKIFTGKRRKDSKSSSLNMSKVFRKQQTSL